MRRDCSKHVSKFLIRVLHFFLITSNCLTNDHFCLPYKVPQTPTLHIFNGTVLCYSLCLKLRRPHHNTHFWTKVSMLRRSVLVSSLFRSRCWRYPLIFNGDLNGNARTLATTIPSIGGVQYSGVSALLSKNRELSIITRLLTTKLGQIRPNWNSYTS